MVIMGRGKRNIMEMECNEAMRITAKTESFARARILCGFSQRELARRAGISHAYISLVERAMKSVGPGTATRISKLLEKDLEELFVIE
jgi:putative transcriptional regulator